MGLYATYCIRKYCEVMNMDLFDVLTMLGGLALFGYFKLRKQRNRLRNEQRLFE